MKILKYFKKIKVIIIIVMESKKILTKFLKN